KLDGMLAVATAFIPDEATAVGEVIGAIPVNPVFQGWTVTQAPGWLSGDGPGVAQIHIAMEVRLVNVDQAEFLPAHLGKARLKLGHEGGSFLWIGFLEHLLAFLPTQMVLLQE